MENLKICKECGGFCCKRCPPIILPSELAKFGCNSITEENFEKLMDKFIFDYWEGKFEDVVGTAYYLRLRTKQDDCTEKCKGCWGGECIALTENGCLFSYENRPEDCKGLIPQKDHHCKSKIENFKEKAIREWTKYLDIIREFLNKSVY